MVQYVSLNLMAPAAEMLKQLAPSPNRRGRYVSELIMRAAQEAGLIEGQQEPTVEDQLAALKQQLAELEARVQQAE